MYQTESVQVPRVPAPALNHTLFKQHGPAQLSQRLHGCSHLGITALGHGSMDYFWLSGHFGQCLAPYGLSVWNLLAWTWPKLSCHKNIKKHTLQAKPFCNIPFCHSVPERRTRRSVSPQEVFEKSPTPQADALSSDCHCLFLRMNFLE